MVRRAAGDWLRAGPTPQDRRRGRGECSAGLWELSGSVVGGTGDGDWKGGCSRANTHLPEAGECGGPSALSGNQCRGTGRCF